MAYVLKADTTEGVVYYMNFIMTTSQKESAQTFKTKKEAEDNKDRFKYLFYYEEPKITIEQL